MTDGSAVTLKSGERFRFMCCDCGLVHDIVLVTHKGLIGLALKRNARSTANARRQRRTP